MRRLALLLTITSGLMLVVMERYPVSAKDNWMAVRSKNFLLVGNGGEKQIRQVGVRLEQYREIFSRLSTRLNINSPIPTTVIVFKNDSSYKPFKPTANTAGFFQPGSDINYIALTAEIQRAEDPFNVIFHEYTHLLVNNHSGKMPLWLDEGLAEFYSTFTITNDRKVVVGRPIANHVFLLREKQMLPLRTLFAVDHSSPNYNESNKQSIFYAQSWALIHYLILGNNGERANQIGKFLELLSTHIPVEDAFREAYGMTFEGMEKELRAYIQRNSYTVMYGNFEDKIDFDRAMQTSSISEAEAQAYIGDLLLHMNRPDSEIYLQKALALDPKLPMAHASLGMLRVKQGKPAEARASLEHAIALGPQNYLVHYYYAYALSREGHGDMQYVSAYPPDVAATIKSEVKKAIDLRPDFPESYGLLAFVNLVTNKDLDETAGMLKRALVTAPNNAHLSFMLAQIHVRKENYEAGRQILEGLANNSDSQVREQAKSLLIQAAAREAEMKKFREYEEQLGAEERAQYGVQKSVEPGGVVEYKENADPSRVLRASLRKPAPGETQANGALVQIDCNAKGFVFVVKVGDAVLRLKTDSFQHINMRTFTSDIKGEVTCGPRKSENVVVCYLPSETPQNRIDGVVKSIEFVPSDFSFGPSR